MGVFMRLKKGRNGAAGSGGSVGGVSSSCLAARKEKPFIRRGLTVRGQPLGFGLAVGRRLAAVRLPRAQAKGGTSQGAEDEFSRCVLIGGRPHGSQQLAGKQAGRRERGRHNKKVHARSKEGGNESLPPPPPLREFRDSQTRSLQLIMSTLGGRLQLKAAEESRQKAGLSKPESG